MTDHYGPFEWHIEVCSICGCQLGPGIGSHTSSGRCLDREHHSAGGIVVRVVAARDALQPLYTAKRINKLTYITPGA